MEKLHLSFSLGRKIYPIKSNLSNSVTDKRLCRVISPGKIMCGVWYKQLLGNYSCHDQTNFVLQEMEAFFMKYANCIHWRQGCHMSSNAAVAIHLISTQWHFFISLLLDSDMPRANNYICTWIRPRMIER